MAYIDIYFKIYILICLKGRIIEFFHPLVYCPNASENHHGEAKPNKEPRS